MAPDAVLVTGASGFVGQHLCAALNRTGRRIITAGRGAAALPGVEHRHWDLKESTPSGLLTGVDTVFHLAGRAHALADTVAYATFYDTVNRIATERLIESAVARDVRALVFASSSKAGPSPDDPYGHSKWQAERAVLAAREALHVAVVRPVLVYGPGCKGNLLQLMRAIDRGRMPRLPAVDNRRSLIGVRDLVRVCQLLASTERAAGGCYVATDREVYSTQRIVDALSVALGRGLPRPSRLPQAAYTALGRVGDVAQTVLRRRLPVSSDAMEKLLGSAEFSSDQLWADLATAPDESLERTVPDMARDYRAEFGGQ